ncbi:MAG: lytic transglycosylase domain-containing protein [Pseudomonadota bacterium]|nr:lytic transglycosylase domain-containing protein [Pseudomonadota bacterium]
MKRLFIIALTVLAFSPVSAYAEDALISGAKLCTIHLPRYEREYAIPTHLLAAIAVTESGRYHDGLKIKVPWPWTINADGRGYVYNSKEEAIAAARAFRARGVQSLDVGCMQVNLYHHPHAFSSLEQAFDPQSNIAYAAGFLSGLYQQDGSWRQAAADYHSKTPRLGREYVSEVYDSWYQIIRKLRAARLQAADNEMAAADETDGAPRVIHAGAKRRHDKAAAYQPVHMDSITLARYDSNDRVVAATRPDRTPVVPAVVVQAQPMSAAPLAVAETRPVLTDAPASGGAPPAGAGADRRNGPTFIFSD